MHPPIHSVKKYENILEQMAAPAGFERALALIDRSEDVTDGQDLGENLVHSFTGLETKCY